MGGRKTHLAENRCPDERWFTGDPCGSSLREENRCSTDSSAIPLSSFTRNPTLLGPTTPASSFSHRIHRGMAWTRIESAAWAACPSKWKQKVTTSLCVGVHEFRGSAEVFGSIYWVASMEIQEMNFFIYYWFFNFGWLFWTLIDRWVILGNMTMDRRRRVLRGTLKGRVLRVVGGCKFYSVNSGNVWVDEQFT